MNIAANYKLFSFFSLFFAILNLIFSYVFGTTFNGILFIWMIAVNIAAGYVKNKKIKYAICILVIPIPFIWMGGITNIIFASIMIAASIFYYYREIGLNNYISTLTEFKNGFMLLLATLVVSIPSGQLALIGDMLVLYMIIYLLSSITLLRTLRVIESSNDTKLIWRLNIRYSIILTTSAIVLSVDVVKNAFFNILGLIHQGISTVFVFFSLALFYIINAVFQFIVKLLGIPVKSGKLQGLDDLFAKLSLTKHMAPGKKVEFRNPIYMKIFFWSIVLVILIFVLMKIFKRNSKSQKNTSVFSEEKEFIRKNKNSENGIRKLFSKLIKPKTNNEQVRFYYIKYLKLCIKNKIEILKSDSSANVNEKAKDIFDSNDLSAIRNIYIKARYDKEQIDSKSCNDFVDNYGKLKKSALVKEAEKA